MDRFDTSRDPRFKRAPRHVRRVQVDGRFARMFKEQQFVETPQVDARGQPLKRSTGKEKLQEFYELAGVEGAAIAPENSENEELEGEDVEEEELDESEEEEEQIDEETVKEDIPQGDATRRFAVMGCDWDHVSAGDLLVMFRTYLQKAKKVRQSGSVDKISVFPSDYGLQQLEREAKEGPLLDASRRGLDEDEAAQQEALRKYQMNRTKYYWALVECNSVSTASWLYDQMDGLEADGVCPASLDLRFVPDDVEPPHEATSVATELPTKFAGPQMLRSATGHTKVKCTWDEPPVQRRKDLMKKRFTPQELAEMDLQAYLDSDSDDEQQGAEDLKALVAGSDSEGFFDESGSEMEKEQKSKKTEGDMEATFSVKASQLEDKLSARAKEEGQGVHTLQQQTQSTWEKYLEKRKQKKRERKLKAKEDKEKLKKMKDHDAKGLGPLPEDDAEELDLLMEDSKERGFNLRGPQRKAHDHGPSTDDLDHFKMNVNDSRISKVFNSADFEIDPTNPEFRKSEGMLEVLKEKRKRKKPQTKVKKTMDTQPTVKEPMTTSKSGLQIFASQKRSDASAGETKHKKRRAT
eukprot:symbB.v1.2.037007.t1/scaffold5354.1/size28145/2